VQAVRILASRCKIERPATQLPIQTITGQRVGETAFSNLFAYHRASKDGGKANAGRDLDVPVFFTQDARIIQPATRTFRLDPVTKMSRFSMVKRLV